MDKIKTFGRKNWLAFLLFMCLFINGFQAGGNQAFLTEIGAELGVETKVLGSLAAAQWCAVIIAPLVTGVFADKVGKKPFMLIFFSVFFLGSLVLIFAKTLILYLIFIFILGLSLSIYQFISMAAMADCYPLTQGKKMGYMTSLYPVGALVAPMVSKLIINLGGTWHILYIILAGIALLEIIGLIFTKFEIKEEKDEKTVNELKPAPAPDKKFMIIGMICLVMITAVFVGVENGIAYFIKPFIKDEIMGTKGELAITLFWAGMIPARFLCSPLRKIKKEKLAFSFFSTTFLCLGFAYLNSEIWTLIFAFLMGFACGDIYTLAMSFSVEFAPGKSALATGLVTSGTGIGGAAVTASVSLLSSAFGIRNAFIFLSIVMASGLIFCAVLIYQIRMKAKKEANKV